MSARFQKQKSEYARSGVDYSVMEPFKKAMIKTGKRTLTFPNKRDVYINAELLHAHGGVYEYRGKLPHLWCNTQEGLGNKNWIAEWMYQFSGTGKTYYEGIGIDTALMAVNDVIAQGAMPVVFTDEVAVGDASWFEDKRRAEDLAEGFYKVCKEVGMALPAGESPALKYLLKSEPPVLAAPSLSGCVTGIIAPSTNIITGENLASGDVIIGVTSSGIHANGISLLIKKALKLPDKFLTRLPNGKTLGEEALIPTRSYVALIEALQVGGVAISALLPGTGSGVAKLAFDNRNYTYRVNNWPTMPLLFMFLLEIGLSMEECLKAFNCGIGYYIFVPRREVKQVLDIGKKIGYELVELGYVEQGKRQVIFEPEKIILPPPGK